MGNKKLRKLQFGLEAVKGTALAASVIWRGTGTIEDQLELQYPEEDVGRLVEGDRAYISKLQGALTIDDTELTFEQLPLLLCIGIDDITDGVQDGAGSDYIYDYVLGVTSDPGHSTFTIEGGDDAGAEEIEYGFAAEITLKGATGEAWMMGANLMARQVVPTTFTGALTLDDVEEAMFTKTTLYIDDSGGTIGTTLVSNLLLDAEITITTGIQPKYTTNGELYFQFTYRGEQMVVVAMTFEHNAGAIAEKVEWRAKNTRLIRLQCLGSAVQTPGTVWSNQAIEFDFAGIWEKFDKIDDVDGNDIVKGTFRARYSPTDALHSSFKVVNELASVIS